LQLLSERIASSVTLNEPVSVFDTVLIQSDAQISTEVDGNQNFDVQRHRGMGLAVFEIDREYLFMKKVDSVIRLLTLAEAASILKISKRTLHRMIQHHQIPAFKVGGQWRILESRFQEWVEEEEHLTSKVG